MLAAAGCSSGLDLILWIVAVLVGIWGLLSLLSGNVIYGVLLIILAFLIGPGGVSLIC